MIRAGLIAALMLPFILNSEVLEAQIRIIPREKVEAVSSPRLSRDSSALCFETKHIVAEPMNEDDEPVTFLYAFRNVSDRSVDIRRLVSTCSCASASVDKMMVAPGESAAISVRYSPKGHPGKFERKVFVYTGYEEPAAVLKLTVDVENGKDMSDEWPVQMGKIRLRRSEVTFRRGEKSVEKLRFINVSDHTISLKCDTDFLPGCISFRTEPETVGSGMEGEVVLSYDPDKNGARDVMKVIVRGLGVPPSKSSITIRLAD